MVLMDIAFSYFYVLSRSRVASATVLPRREVLNTDTHKSAASEAVPESVFVSNSLGGRFSAERHLGAADVFVAVAACNQPERNAESCSRCEPILSARQAPGFATV